jgi:hypothetical protein
MIDLIACSPELACLRVEALYNRDRRGRLVSVNEWKGTAAPRFHLMRTARKSFGQHHADLADDLVVRLEELRAQEPTGRRQGKLPGLCSKFLELLAFHAPVARVWAGPVFKFPEDMAADVRTVSITRQMPIFFAVVLTIGCLISATDNRSVPWSITIVLFRFAPASASRMRFTAPEWKHSPGTGGEAMPPAP